MLNVQQSNFFNARAPRPPRQRRSGGRGDLLKHESIGFTERESDWGDGFLRVLLIVMYM
jgi:hypothetical protein